MSEEHLIQITKTARSLFVHLLSKSWTYGQNYLPIYIQYDIRSLLVILISDRQTARIKLFPFTVYLLEYIISSGFRAFPSLKTSFGILDMENDPAKVLRRRISTDFIDCQVLNDDTVVLNVQYKPLIVCLLNRHEKTYVLSKHLILDSGIDIIG